MFMELGFNVFKSSKLSNQQSTKLAQFIKATSSCTEGGGQTLFFRFYRNGDRINKNNVYVWLGEKKIKK